MMSALETNYGQTPSQTVEVLRALPRLHAPVWREGQPSSRWSPTQLRQL